MLNVLAAALLLTAASTSLAQTVADPWVYTVSGAGMSVFNGTYTQFSPTEGVCTATAGCAAFAGGFNPIKYLLYDAFIKKWYLIDLGAFGSPAAYVYTADQVCGGIAPPTTGWQVNNTNPENGFDGFWTTFPSPPWNPWPASAGTAPTLSHVSGPTCPPDSIDDGGLSASVGSDSDWGFAPLGSGASDSRGFISLAEAQDEDLVEGAPAGMQSVSVLVSFRLITTESTPLAAVVTINFGAPIPEGAQYWKYGPETSGAEPSWYQFSSAVIDNAAGTVTLTMTDGQQGDADWAENGEIRDPGGLFLPQANGAVASIPTLSEWGMIIMSSLMAIGAIMGLRRRKV